MKSKISIHPKTIYTGNNGFEITAGIELSETDIATLVRAVVAADPWHPFVLVLPGGYKQRLTLDEMETVLAEPLAAYRAELATLAAKDAEARQKALEAAEAQQKAAEAAQATLEAQKQTAPVEAIF